VNGRITNFRRVASESAVQRMVSALRMVPLRYFPYLSIRRLRLILVGTLQQPEPRCLRFRGAGSLPSIK
jgi:hypothetical protein